MPARPKRDATELEKLLRTAIEAKSRDLSPPGTYHRLSRRELQEMAHVEHSEISNAMSGNRRPKPDTLRKLADALAPYLDIDQALIAAGHTPQSPAFLDLLRRLATLPPAVRDALDRRWFAPPPDGDAEGETGEADSEHIAEDDANP